jgi:TRAP-type C4-dicarboxylate transport system permease large subunit
MSEGGLALRLVNLAHLFVGRIRGGLAMVNSVACMFFGNISGSAVADVSSVGSVMIPMMKKRGYDADFAVGVTISSAIQGVVVPPSHNHVLYSLVAGGISIASLFMAGVIPG